MIDQMDAIAVLSAASWPVLLVDQSAKIREANAAAQDFFGEKVVGGAAPLVALWTNENGADPAGFLDKVTAGKSLTTPLKLRGKGIAITPFHASVCSLDQAGAKCFLFQLFPNSPVAAGSARHSVSPQDSD